MDPDFGAWLEWSPEQLQAYGCIKEQVELEMHNRKGDGLAVIALAARLRESGILDGAVLEREAKALYSLGRHQEALEVYLESLEQERQCKVFVFCPREAYAAEQHYILFEVLSCSWI